MHKAGFVNIIGNPNVGKSTLMNALVGEKLSIITSKAQTTRHRIMGIVNGKDFQVVYSDTPGILKPNYGLQKSMMSFVEEALSDADVFLVVIDAGSKEEPDPKTIARIKKSKVPVIVVLNKLDVAEGEKLMKLADRWSRELEGAEVVPVSALKHINVEKVFELIMKYLPEHPPYFDKEEITDRTERFFVSEIIREKILKNYQKEIPYATEVAVESFKEDEKIIKIRAIVYVERESQKAIILGHKGEAIKKMATEARLSIEHFLSKKVFIELFVKVDKDWRNNEGKLKKFGY
jgi:GTPase